MLRSAVQCISGHNNSIKIINRKFMSLIFIGSVRLCMYTIRRGYGEDVIWRLSIITV